MAYFPSNLIAQSTIVYVSVFVLMLGKNFFSQFMLLFYLDNGFVIKFLVIPCLLLDWIGFSRETVDLCSIDMIDEYQPLIINTFVVMNVVPVIAQLCSYGRIVSFFVVVLYVAVIIEGENRMVIFSKRT